MFFSKQAPFFSCLLTTVAQTESLGKALGYQAVANDLILLQGPLGIGKTRLAEAVARGLQVPAEQYVTSPAIALLHEYYGRLPLYHIDCYRLSNSEAVKEAGLLAYLQSDGLTLVECPERLGEQLPADFLEIRLMPQHDGSRQAAFYPNGQCWVQRIERLQEQFKDHLFSRNET